MHAVNQKGGMLVYYHFYNDTRLATSQGWGNENIDAFPRDFKMIAGDPFRRDAPGPDATQQEKLAHNAIGFNCLRYGSQNEGSLEHHAWRKDDWKECVDGIRAELFFPSCWDGRLDSPNHKDHVVYPDETKFGKCPETHKKRLPSLMFETIWDTHAFATPEYEGGEFVWSNGDVTGYGYHGDFQNAWVEGVQEQLMREPSCYNDGLTDGQLENCKVFKPEDIRSKAEMEACQAESEWAEDVGTGEGFRASASSGLTALPGCIEITRGPGRAAVSKTCDVNGKPIDGSSKKPSEGALLDESKNKGVKVEAPKEEPKAKPSSTIDNKPADVKTVKTVEAPAAPAPTSSNKYLVIVTTTVTRTLTEGEPIPTEWLRRRHVHGKHRRHHNH